MKAIYQICRILTAVLSVCAVVLFFFTFVNVTVGQEVLNISGANMVFGTTVGENYNLQGSSYLAFTFALVVLSAITAVVAIFTKKGNGARIASFVSSGIAGIIMLVAGLSKVLKFSDLRPIVTEATASKFALAYEPIVLIAAFVILASFVIGVLTWLVNDYILVLASKGQRVSIFGKVVNFFRENIAEIRKIVWPNGKTVLRNSIIVVIMCAILGAFIWIVDFALGSLVNFITTL